MEKETELEKFIKKLREQMLNAICKEFEIPKSLFDEPEQTIAAEYEEETKKLVYKLSEDFIKEE